MKRFYIFSLAIVGVLFSLSCCNKTPGGDDTAPEEDADAAYADLKKVKYESTDALFPNPERGFFTHLEFFSNGNMSPITQTQLESQRLLNRSLIFTIYYMPDYMDCPIAESYLTFLKQNLQTLRENGFKCVLRFAYNRSYDESAHPWDASEEIVHSHIDQLKPIFDEYSDVIFCLEAGFVGTFGEWYYTDNFNYQPKTEEDYQPRRRLMDKLLEVLPEDRQVLVRYPAAKLMMYGLTVADSLTVDTAHDGSDISRIGHHNDCFVSSTNDVGTYMVIENDRQYTYNETRYLIWGGETCAVTAYCDCSRALGRCEDHHMTYLNNDYHQGVIARWKEQGCYEEIDRRMGYRLVLDRAFYTPEPQAGEEFRVVLKIKNVGFAAPMNPRDAQLVLVSGTGDAQIFPLEDVDPRFWFENIESTVDVNIDLPDGASGEYKLYLCLPDPEETLKDDPRYSIRLANTDMWDETKGWNLLTTINL